MTQNTRPFPPTIAFPPDPGIGAGSPLVDRLGLANARAIRGHKIGFQYRIPGLAVPPEQLPRLTAVWFRDGASVVVGDTDTGYQYVTTCSCVAAGDLGQACGHVLRGVIHLEGLAPTGKWRERSSAEAIATLVGAAEPAEPAVWLSAFTALWVLRGRSESDMWRLPIAERQRLLAIWRTEVKRQFRNCREVCERCAYPILQSESECQFCAVVRSPLGLNSPPTTKPDRAAEPVTASLATPAAAAPADAPPPPIDLTDELREKIRALDDAMLERIAGQDEAIDAVHRVIKRQATGVGNPDKPVGVFLFLGPTGVGKTELAKTIADVLGWPLKRFDMSEFKDDAAVNRFLGSAPGYVGYDRGGELTNFLLANTRSVVIFDEFEKAHPKIGEVLLQLFDEGRLTDGQGRTTLNGRGAVFVMTSNLGAHYYTTREGQSLTREQREARILDELRSLFPPEFLNRLDEIVFFNNLGPVVLASIAEGMLRKLDAQLERLRGHDVRWDREVLDFLITHGTEPGMGARPLQRAIDRYVRTPIADLILEQTVPPGAPIVIHCEGDHLSARIAPG